MSGPYDFEIDRYYLTARQHFGIEDGIKVKVDSKQANTATLAIINQGGNTARKVIMRASAYTELVSPDQHNEEGIEHCTTTSRLPVLLETWRLNKQFFSTSHYDENVALQEVHQGELQDHVLRILRMTKGIPP